MANTARPFKARHTPAQWLVLGVNVLVVLACLGGAVGLMYGKRQAEKRLQTPKVAIATTTTHVIAAALRKLGLGVLLLGCCVSCAAVCCARRAGQRADAKPTRGPTAP